MVKFSKQFEGQLVPEWKEAFVDYWKLKKDLKKILLVETNSQNRQQKSSLSNTLLVSLRKLSLFGHREHGTIQVHKKLASSASNGDLYKTELLERLADAEGASEFFACLDLQLNKVNQFYKTKEKEFMERGESLKKQMEILIELKTALKKHGDEGVSSEDASISSTISSEEGSVRDTTETKQLQDNATDSTGKNNAAGSPKSDEMKKPKTAKMEDGKSRILPGRSFSFQGKNLRMNIPASAVNYFLVWEDLAKQTSKKWGQKASKPQINKTKLHHAGKMIRGALIELYKGLGYLKNYRQLNMLAFVKILKKFDKVTGKQVLPIYLKVVETSYINSSDKVMKLADEVEELFIKHFAEGDRRKAMKYLKPHQRKESHTVTFAIGLFTGCFLALFAGYVILAHITGTYTRNSDTVYMETVYPVFSMFILMFLHLFLYGCNIFMWKKIRINYSFILELVPTKELKYRDAFFLCTMSMTAVVGVMLIHLSLLRNGYSSPQIHAIHGLLILVFLLLLICPFNIIYRSTRYRFLRVMRNIVLSPLYKVVMLDFFMADQLCSQVPMLRDLEYMSCYYITGSYKNQDYGYCMRTTYYRDLAYAVSFLPYYWRAMQCARRWFDEGETSHLVNLGKYVSAMLAAGAKVAYEKERSMGWLSLVVAVSSGATVYQLYWDFVKDWGLLQVHSKNPWLRNELMLSRKFVYYFFMALNLVLRLAWLQTVIHSNFGSLDYRVTSLFLAALEVLRRGLWNFFRLENEHLNNAGKFRAVNTVPLPFHEVDEEG